MYIYIYIYIYVIEHLYCVYHWNLHAFCWENANMVPFGPARKSWHERLGDKKWPRTTSEIFMLMFQFSSAEGSTPELPNSLFFHHLIVNLSIHIYSHLSNIGPIKGPWLIPLVKSGKNYQFAPGKIMGKSYLFLWSFSIAMLTYQMVGEF